MLAEYIHIITDPAHGLAEFTYSLFIDLILFGLIWGTLWTKWLKPRLKSEVHSEIDAEHGYVNHVKADGKIPDKVVKFYFEKD
jgi:hypothetical protein